MIFHVSVLLIFSFPTHIRQLFNIVLINYVKNCTPCVTFVMQIILYHLDPQATVPFNRNSEERHLNTRPKPTITLQSKNIDLYRDPLRIYSKNRTMKMTGKHVLTVSRSTQTPSVPFSRHHSVFKTVAAINTQSWEGFLISLKGIQVYPHLSHVKYVLVDNLVVHTSCTHKSSLAYA